MAETPNGQAPGADQILTERKKRIFSVRTVVFLVLGFLMERYVIRRLADLDIEICCFGHGPPHLSGARDRNRALADTLPRP